MVLTDELNEDVRKNQYFWACQVLNQETFDCRIGFFSIV